MRGAEYMYSEKHDWGPGLALCQVKYQESSIGFENLAYLQSIANKCKGLQKLGKTNIHFYKYILGVSDKYSTADNLVYGELGKVLCQLRFKWKQVKFWNRLIWLLQCRLAYTKSLGRLLSILDNNSWFVRNTKYRSEKINKLSYWNNKQQTPNCRIYSDIKENINFDKTRTTIGSFKM